jgi:hypothetical protein
LAIEDWDCGDLFNAIGLRLLQGRGFEPDRTGVPRTAIVTQAAAQRHFKGETLGQMIALPPQARSMAPLRTCRSSG